MDKDINKKDIIPAQKNDFNESFGPTIMRAEKIVAAIYMVSGLVNENDPLRHSIRNESVDFLSLISKKDFSGNIIKNKIDHIISLLNVSYFAGFISEMNLNILGGEIISFGHEVLKDDADRAHNLISSNKKLPQYSKGVSSAPVAFGNTGGTNRLIKDKIRPSESVDSPVFAKKVGRRDSIISVLKKMSDITIKEISSQIEGCSEKTVQRELAALINEGLVKRKGERRWSLYSLA